MCWSINLSVPSCSVSRLPLSSWLLTPRSKPRHLDMHIDECDAPLDETIIHLLVEFSASSIYRTSCLVLILHAPTATKVTFNFGITSHDNFEGNDLTFCGMFDAADHRKYHHTNLVGTKSAHLHSIMLQCLPVAHGLPRFTSIIMHYHCIMVGVGRTYFCFLLGWLLILLEVQTCERTLCGPLWEASPWCYGHWKGGGTRVHGCHHMFTERLFDSGFWWKIDTSTGKIYQRSWTVSEWARVKICQRSVSMCHWKLFAQGERASLIMWTKSRTFRRTQAEQLEQHISTVPRAQNFIYDPLDSPGSIFFGSNDLVLSAFV